MILFFMSRSTYDEWKIEELLHFPEALSLTLKIFDKTDQAL